MDPVISAGLEGPLGKKKHMTQLIKKKKKKRAEALRQL